MLGDHHFFYVSIPSTSAINFLKSPLTSSMASILRNLCAAEEEGLETSGSHGWNWVCVKILFSIVWGVKQWWKVRVPDRVLGRGEDIQNTHWLHVLCVGFPPTMTRVYEFLTPVSSVHLRSIRASSAEEKGGGRLVLFEEWEVVQARGAHPFSGWADSMETFRGTTQFILNLGWKCASCYLDPPSHKKVCLRPSLWISLSSTSRFWIFQ